MRHFDAVGREVVCTATREEWERQQDVEPVHFVWHEYAVWSDE